MSLTSDSPQEGRLAAFLAQRLATHPAVGALVADGAVSGRPRHRTVGGDCLDTNMRSTPDPTPEDRLTALLAEASVAHPSVVAPAAVGAALHTDDARLSVAPAWVET